MPTQSNFDKFGSDTQALLLRAQELAEQRNHGTIGTEHLLLGLLTLPAETTARQILGEYMVDTDQVELVLSIEAIPEGRSSRNGMTDEARKVLEQSALQAIHTRSTAVDPTHILWAIVSDKTCAAFAVLAKTGVQPEHLRSQLEQLFHEHAHLDRLVEQHLDIFELGEDNMDDSGMPSMPTNSKKKSALETLTTDLVALATKGELDPMIGREEELKRLVHILLRRTKNNPVLIGEPGVGKTSIVEGFAQLVANGNVPPALKSISVRRLDVATLIAGTMYRGQFEDRMRKLIQEIEEKGNVVLFIDELHTVIGAGSAEGSLDAANILKPALTKAKIRLIGATTLDEYQKHIEKDAAFERRFQPIVVREPSLEETKQILYELKSKLAEHHQVEIPDDVIDLAVRAADRYLPGRRFPDKAIDVIDEAAASIQVASTDRAGKHDDAIKALEQQLKTASREKTYELKRKNLERAAFLRDIELKLKLKLAHSRQPSDTQGKLTLEEKHVLATVSRMSAIPIEQLTNETLNSNELTERLELNILGQTNAVKQAARAIVRARIGLKPAHQPQSALLFVGPTGVGKTELAYTLTRELFGNSDALIRLDMSEYREPHTVSRLIGAPPGYVGHEEAGRLTERVRQRPASVILFDEVEKAHPDVFNTLLQILDYGTLTDAKGRAVSFRNAHIILTTNVGADVWSANPPGFSETNNTGERAKSAVQSLFKPELLNRLDDIVVFSPLSAETLSLLIDRRVEALNKRLAVHKLIISLHSSAKNELVKRAEKSLLGARELDRLLAEHVESPAIELLAKHNLRTVQQTQLMYRADEFQLIRVRSTNKTLQHA